MMDHARHLSSPSPTSPFLFHHSERPFKSNPLNPLLSSAVDGTSVDDCFSTTSSSITHASHNAFGVDHHHSLVDGHHHHHHHNHHHLNHHNHHHHHNHQQNNRNPDDQCVIDQDSLTGVDDDDGMHNMLSGSSTSSTSTMPLLTESHSHHSFSRISLEEYSPLSLVEDCDNALPISPTSLACGSHHSFKSSLNGLKMDNLGDVGVNDHDDVNDARSLSPSLLSTSTSNHHNNNNNNNLWSTSSTAITQNTSLLNSTSTSFLLSHHHHHHHQLNSFIQQLEPQSLDEPPPLVSNSTNLDSSSAPSTAHRPSSEPPSGCGIGMPDVDSKSLNCQSLPPKSSKQLSKKATNGNKASQSSVAAVVVSSPAPSNSRSRKSRTKSVPSKQVNGNNGSNKCHLANKRHSTGSSEVASLPLNNQQSTHNSKVHLQLNHHKKLQELQQRLFGSTTTTATSNKSSETDVVTAVGDSDANAPATINKDSATLNTSTAATNQSSSSTSFAISGSSTANVGTKDEPDSSATSKDRDLAKSAASSANQATNETSKTRSRQATKSRRSRGNKSETCNPSSSTSSGASKSVQKTVTTESVEPDTTTKSSDCIKLADLLSGNGSNNAFSSNGFASTTSESSAQQTAENGGEKRQVQQIQVQVTPSLTVVANGGLMHQSMGAQQQQQQQQQQQSNGAVLNTSSGATFTSQILCRPQTVMSASAGQLKGIMSNNELLKSNETLVSNWSLQANNSNNSTTTTSLPNGQAIGAHQIAIQVICQDGTSLVLPVSSAASLNAAVSLTSQHQQLQAVLANNAANQQRNSGQLLPLMSVSNIVAQQQLNNNSTAATTNNTENSGQNSNTQPPGSQSSTTTVSQASGLAASSPTLAALLDAGFPSRSNSNDLNNNNSNLSSQNFVSTNLLRKLVSGNANEGAFKRGELTIQQGSTLNLANCGGSLVTVCAPNSSGTNQATSKNFNGNNNIGEKRIKLENADGNKTTTSTTTATFTLIDPQSVIVTHGNERTNGKQAVPQNTLSTATSSARTGSQTQSGCGGTIKPTSETATASSKQSKMGSSTGNRQVDPTQPFRCEHCNSTFTRLGNFTRHKKIHTVPTKDGQRFKCDVCSKSFLQRCDLARHLHIHRGTEPHRCNICGKGYIRHSDLVTHQRFHNKEKPFGCPHCNKGFCQRGDLNRHLRSIHLQMKPILCPCCNRKFAKQETLLRHLNTAHRSKPGTTTANTVVAELPPNYTLTQGDDKQTTISVVTSAAVLNNNNVASKSAPVASLQAIQATLCKVSQSDD